ncbi:transcription termination factor MTERF2, chloroplastic [Andrographis paniculata]|uniref:transcription termination factor MTERF2, chloroplastic n=1 Tax=Andrographis paniculata TaxID=175694 RepID=UPI0021E947E9|nr:transcription termination factor MTERF2, chloroplastic [Andrographis paniculata]
MNALILPYASMATLNLHRRHYCPSSYSFSSIFHPHPTNCCVSLPPHNPLQTSISTSFSLLTTSISLPNNRHYIRHFASAIHNQDSEQDSCDNRLDEAREAVMEYLEQAGASREEASQISHNCPNYLSTLIDAVDDLDVWNSTTETTGHEIEADSVEFGKKVRQMAEQKGDKGILPFLESLGFSLSTASHFALYLSSSDSNLLPLLIHKVKYLKDVFFADSDDHDLIGKNAQRMIANLSISADEDLQQTLAFFEKIQARRGGLNLLGSEQTSFRLLIESFPRVLFLPLKSHVQPIVKFLGDIGVPREKIGNVLLPFPSIVFYDIGKDIKPRLQLYEKIGVNDNDLGKMLVKYPWMISSSILHNFEKVIRFFDEEKVPKHCSCHAIKNWPHILGCSIDKLKVMVKQFGELGVTSKKLGKVIATSPQLLLRKPQEFVQVVSFFEDLGLDEEEIAKTLCRCPEIFATNIDKTLQKKLEFLHSVGISGTHLPRVVRKYPELFVCDVNRALLPRVRYLMRIGLSKKEIKSMVSRFSPLLGYSIEEVLKPKLEFLLYTMRKPLSTVVDYPRYFSYSLEKRIKPRYKVLTDRKMEFTLKEMLGKNDEEFAAVYLANEEMSPPLS